MKKLCALVALIMLPYSICHATNRYIGTNGSDSGTCTSQASPCRTINYALGHMSGGDILTIGDGNYSEQIRNVPSGSAGAYTTIQAQNVGRVLIDWSTGSDWNSGVDLRNSSYIKIDGIKVKGNASNDTNSPFRVQSSDHIKLTRCAGYNASTTGNVDVFGLGPGNSYILVEDCWAWGGGRYKFNVYQSTNVIVRRCVSRHDYMADARDGSAWHKQVANFTTYDSDNVVFQNCIGIDSGSSTTALDSTGEMIPIYGQSYGGIWSENNNYLSRAVTATGCIFLNIKGLFQYGGVIHDPKLYDQTRNWSDIVAWDVDGNGYLADNVYIENGSYYAINLNRFTFGYLAGGAGVVADNSGKAYTISALIKNSILNQISGPAIGARFTSSYNNFFGNGANGTIGTRSTTTNPRAWGLVYLPRIESGSALATAGEFGGQIGANILWKIGLDGTLYGDTGWNTERNAANGYGRPSDRLWPWQYEALIKTDMASYSGPGPSGARGFCSGTDRSGNPQSLTKYIWEYLGNMAPLNYYSDIDIQPPRGLKILPSN